MMKKRKRKKRKRKKKKTQERAEKENGNGGEEGTYVRHFVCLSVKCFLKNDNILVCSRLLCAAKFQKPFTTENLKNLRRLLLLNCC